MVTPQVRYEDLMATVQEVQSIMEAPWIYPGLVKRSQTDLVLSFWINDSLGHWTSRSILAERNAYFVRRIQWARREDRVRVHGESPTTFGSEASVAEQLVKQLLSVVGDLVANQPEHTDCPGIVLDGASYRITLNRNGLLQDFNWGNGVKLPAALGAWIEQACHELDAFLPSPTIA
jgi:hypothetical protein